MAMTGKLVGDFSSFKTAVEEATAKLSTFQTGAAGVEKSLNRMVESLSGKKVIQEATLMAEAVERLGGVSQLTGSELQRVGAQAAEALAKMKAVGITDIPPNLKAIADAAKEATSATEGWTGSIVKLGTSMVAQIASGELLATAIKAVGGELLDMAKALPELALKGAGIADVEDNFNHMAEAAGRVGASMVGALAEGTHNTISNFELMKVASRDLAAGMNLTDAQFGTLSKGAFALAQATGTDVKAALDTMNDAMLTGKTRALGLLTGKIDLGAAEERYAKSIGTTADHLTDEGKLEAARAAILASVGGAIDRIGEQSDGLDEKVAQLQTTWANFTDELGKVIAKSPVVLEAFNTIEDAIRSAFGANQESLIASLAKAVDAVAIGLVELGRVGVQVAAQLAREFRDVKHLFDLMAQGIDKINLLRLQAIPSQIPDSVPAEVKTATLAVNKQQIDELKKAIAERTATLEADRAALDKINAAEQAGLGFLDSMVTRMKAARDASAEFVGPLESVAAGHKQAGAAAGAHAGLIKQTKEELTAAAKEAAEYAAALLSLSISQRGAAAVTDDYGAATAEAIRWELQHGAAVEDVARVYKIAAPYVREVEKAIKDEAKAAKDAAEAANLLGSIHYKVESSTRSLTEALGKGNDEELTAIKNALALADALKKVESVPAPQPGFLNPTMDALTNLGKRSTELEDVKVKLEQLPKITDEWASSLDVLGKHLTQIGGIDLRPLIQQVEHLVKVKDGIEKASAYAAPSTRSSIVQGGLIGGITGAEDVAGGSSAGSALGKVGMAGATAAAGTIAAAAASTAGITAASIGSAVALGAATMGIGAAAVGVALLAKHWLAVSQAEKDARAAFGDLQKEYGSLDETIKGVGAAYAAVGKSGAEAQRDLQRALDATHVSADAERKALEPINAVLAQAKQRAEDVAAATASLTPAFTAIVAGTADVVKGYDAIKSAVDEAGAAQKAAREAGDEVGAARAARDLAKAVEAQGKAAAGASSHLADLGVQAVATFAASVAGGKSVAATLAEMGPALGTLRQSYADLGLDVDNVALKNLLMQSAIMDGNPTLVAAVEGLATEMEALDKMGLLTVDTFEAMERTGTDTYLQLQAKAAEAGGTTKDALVPMQKYLHDAADEAVKLGVPLDDNTQMLIDQSKELGIWKDKGKDATTALTDSMGDLVAKVSELIDRLAGPGGVVDAIAGIPRTVDVTVQGHYVPPPEVPSVPVPAAQGHAYGGVAMPDAWGTPSGTDSVRAWLTPGERVLTVSDTKALDEAGGVAALRGGGSVIDFDRFVAEQEKTRREIAGLRSDMSTFPASVARMVRDSVAQGGRRR
jgi:hypothetical protein